MSLRLGGDGHARSRIPEDRAADAFEIIDDTTGPVVLNNFEDGGGAYTVTTAEVTFPQFSGTLFGQPLTVDVDPLQNLTGTYDAATGAVTGNTSNWEATIDFAGDPCTISPIPLAFTTNTNTVFEGNAFDAPAVSPGQRRGQRRLGQPAAGYRRRLRPDQLGDQRAGRPLAVERHRAADVRAAAAGASGDAGDADDADDEEEEAQEGFKKKKVKGKVKCVRRRRRRVEADSSQRGTMYDSPGRSGGALSASHRAGNLRPARGANRKRGRLSWSGWSRRPGPRSWTPRRAGTRRAAGGAWATTRRARRRARVGSLVLGAGQPVHHPRFRRAVARSARQGHRARHQRR